MEIFFQDPSEIPLPPDEVRIRTLKADPSPDFSRLRVYLEVDPFQVKPNLELVVTNPDGNEISTASVIESITRKIELTMHLRGNKPDGEYTLNAILYFRETSGDGDNINDLLEEPKIVDKAECKFHP